MSAPTMHRTASLDVACETCGGVVHLTAQPVRWGWHRGQWEVFAWGPATGECCGTAYVAPCLAIAPPSRARRARLPDFLDDDDITLVSPFPFPPPSPLDAA